jgi:hypothetical protein
MLFIISGLARSAMLGIVREDRCGMELPARPAYSTRDRSITTNNDRSGNSACKFQLCL